MYWAVLLRVCAHEPLLRVQASHRAGSTASNDLGGLASRRGSATSGEQHAVVRSLVGSGPGEDARATLMIRNIPNKYSQKVRQSCSVRTQCLSRDLVHLML
jgi:hypothetical protein